MVVSFIILILSFTSYEKEIEANNKTNYNIGSCGKYKGKVTYKGSRGGCYYINKNKKKTYVDRKYCPC